MRRPRLAAIAMAAGVAASLIAAPEALGHEEVPGIRNVLVSVEPALPDGVTVDVVISAADQVVVTNTTDQLLEVPGADGEPFLRIGPDGVEANFRSPTWHRTLNPDEGGALPPEADAAAEPQFVRVSEEPSWGWFDHRLHAVPVRSAPDVEPGGTAVLERWAIPFTVGGTDHVARGRREYSRPSGAFVAAVVSVPDGLQATVLAGLVPAIAVVRTGDVTVEVLGPDGEVFARLSDEVQVDRRSELWRLTTAVRDTGDPPPVPEADDAAEFVPYEAGGQLVWLEPRAVYPEEVPPADVAPDRATVLLEWEVPLVVDGRAGFIEGTTSWVPTGVALSPTEPVTGGSDGDGPPAWALPALVGALATAVAVAVRRRRAVGTRRQNPTSRVETDN